MKAEISTPHLDLFSTSPTTALQERRSDTSPCIYNAPFFAYKTTERRWRVVQGNCHHWDCPRCGLGRAKEEYGRMVSGCKSLGAKQNLYFITITCKGREMSIERAEKDYGHWTNKLLDACRIQAKRRKQGWFYVQVTERQRRKHPHSHFISTYCPEDACPVIVNKERKTENGKSTQKTYASLRSNWFQEQLFRSGLGEQYEITKVDEPEAASRYVAKYLFKESIFVSDWPKGWKRIRYSQSFPKLPKKEGDAIVLLRLGDWVELSQRAVVVDCLNSDVYEIVHRKMTGSDCIINLRQ